jgi:hypothetical protein
MGHSGGREGNRPTLAFIHLQGACKVIEFPIGDHLDY